MRNNNYCISLIMNICAIQRSFRAVNVDLVYPLCLAHLLDSQLKEKLVVFPIFLSYMHRRPFIPFCAKSCILHLDSCTKSTLIHQMLGFLNCFLKFKHFNVFYTFNICNVISLLTYLMHHNIII